MLRQCFEIFGGIGPGTAGKIRQVGIRSWHEALTDIDAVPVGRKRRLALEEELRAACERFEASDTLYFERVLKPREAWRLCSSFAERVIYFDIETTGLSPYSDDITLICTYSPVSRTFFQFIRGENLGEFPRTIRQGDILVGFNSRTFDMPFMYNTFGDRLPEIAQVDLRWVLQGLGISGSLKKIEQSDFGIRRPRELEGFAGEQAVAAWFEWQRTGDREILNRLVRYCSADAIVLDYLLRETCRRSGCGRFDSYVPPEVLFRTPRRGEWAEALPDIPPPLGETRLRVVPAPSERAHKLAASERPETADDSEYKLVFLMALLDECVTKEERHVLDLFATMYGLSRRQQEDAERDGRSFYRAQGLTGIGDLVLARGREDALRGLQQLLMFAFVDGTLDKRERTLIVALARELAIGRAEFDGMRLEALRRGKELTARLK